MSSDSEQKEAGLKARNALLVFGSSSVVWQIISWAFTVYIARILSPEDYGIIALAGSLRPYFFLLLTFNFHVWYIQKQDAGVDEEKLLFTLFFFLSFLVAFLCYFLSDTLSVLLGDQRAADIFKLTSISLLLQGLTILPEAKLKRELEYKHIAYMNLVLVFLRHLLTITLALKGYHYWSLIIGQLFKDFLALVWMHVVSPVNKTFFFKKSIFKEASRYALFSSSGSFFWMASSKIDDLLVGKLLGVKTLGFYTMAYFLSELPLSKLNHVIGHILTTYFSKLKNNLEALSVKFLEVHKNLAFILAPAFIGMALVAPEFIMLVLGEKWLGVVDIFRVMCVVWTLIGCLGQVTRLFNATDRPEYSFISYFINFFLLLFGFYFGIKYYGETGLFITWLTVYPLTVLVLLLLFKKATGITVLKYLRNFTEPFISVLIMAIIVYFTREFLLGKVDGVVNLIISSLVGFVTYILVVKTFFKEDFNNAIAVLKGEAR